MSIKAGRPHRFTSYERDADGSDDAMMRRYGLALSRFSQPDPSDGSYNMSDPQSFNRYSYVQNDPVNFVDPSGLFTNCGQGNLPACEPAHNPWDDLPRNYDHLPIVMPVPPPADPVSPGPIPQKSFEEPGRAGDPL